MKLKRILHYRNLRYNEFYIVSSTVPNSLTSDLMKGEKLLACTCEMSKIQDMYSEELDPIRIIWRENTKRFHLVDENSGEDDYLAPNLKSIVQIYQIIL